MEIRKIVVDRGGNVEIRKIVVDRLRTLPKRPGETLYRTLPRLSPNEPCPCGSGRKLKKCCNPSTSYLNAAGVQEALAFNAGVDE